MLGIYLGRWRWCNNHVCEEPRAQNAKRALALSFPLLSFFYSDIWKKYSHERLWPAGDYGIVSRGGGAAFETRLCHDIVIFRYIRSIIKRRSRQLGHKRDCIHDRFTFDRRSTTTDNPVQLDDECLFALKIISQKHRRDAEYLFASFRDVM